MPSIAVPQNVPIPFRDAIGSLRFDWAQSAKSQWFLRSSEDNYLTHNDLVQQATLPSTGLTTHNNYWNGVLSNTYAFSPTWLGTFVFDASLLHLTQTRNSALGFALAFPFSSTTLTVSGFETYGDNQFATPITLFPSLRNQQKYQFRYDVGHGTGDHSFKFGVNFIHEPVLGGAFPGNQETLYSFPNDPTFYTANPAQFAADYANGASTTPAQRRKFFAERAAAGTLCARFVAAFAASHSELWTAVANNVWTVHGGRAQPDSESVVVAAAVVWASGARAGRMIASNSRRALGLPTLRASSGHTVVRAGFGLFYNDLAQNGWAAALQAVNGGANPPAALIDSNYKTPYAMHVTGGVQHAFNPNWTVSADYTHEEGNHGIARIHLRLPDRRASFPLGQPVELQRADAASCKATCHNASTWSRTTLFPKRKPGDACWASCLIM